MSDLLLNAVALEIVLGVDELIFESLLPARVRKLTENLEGLPLPRKSTMHGMDLEKLSTSVFVGVLLLCAEAFVLRPNTQIRIDAKDALCAGEQSFVFSVDGLGSLGWAYTEGGRTKTDRAWVMEEDAAKKLSADNYIVELVLGGDRLSSAVGDPFLLENCDIPTCYDASEETKAGRFGLMEPWDEDLRPACCSAIQSKQMQVEAGTFSIKARQAQTTSDANALWNPGCVDVLSLPGFYEKLNRNAFAAAISDEPCGGCPYDAPLCLPDGSCGLADFDMSNPSCELIRSYCDLPSLAGLRARQLCPVTCGCRDPRSSLALGLPNSGCGEQCYRSVQFQRSLDEMPCEDVAVDDPTWQALTWSLENATASFPMDWANSAKQVATFLRTWGCSWITMTPDEAFGHGMWHSSVPYGLNLCYERHTFWPIKPLSYFCPVACGCHNGDPHCPRTCPCADDSCPANVTAPVPPYDSFY